MAFASVAQLRSYLPQVPEYGQQLVTVSVFPFTLTYEGVSTGSLATGATATAVQTALRAITAIGAGGVNVKGKPGGPYTAAFQGVLATDAALLTGTNVTIVPATDSVLQSCLDRASDIVRTAMRSLLADVTFDYAAWGAPSTKIVRGYATPALRLPPYKAGSVTAVAYQSGYAPSAYTAIDATWWEVQADTYLYRVGGWGSGSWGGGWSWGDGWVGIGDSAIDLGFGLRGAFATREPPRYQITAVWGYGPTPPDAIVEVTLEVAVNIYRSRDTGGFLETVGVDGAGATRLIAGLTKLQSQVLQSIRDQFYEVVL